LRVTGSQLRFERQFGQVGAEIIGATSAAADAEVIVMATSALRDLGMSGLTVDLGLPTLVPAILADQSLRQESWAHIRAALDRKDEVAFSKLAPIIGDPATSLISSLVCATGRADHAIDYLQQAPLPAHAASERMELIRVFERIKAEVNDLTISIDPLENRGFEYHTGVTFTLFARDVVGELGRGGRYLAALADSPGEPATGITLFMDSIVRSLPMPRVVRRVFLPVGTPSSAGRRLRAEGWVTVHGLEKEPAPGKQAAAQRCTHVFIDGKAHKVTS
jgi:ATP phosphoribosyltransferase regulatory subunit